METRVFESIVKDENGKKLHFQIYLPMEAKIGQAVEIAEKYLSGTVHEKLSKENFYESEITFTTHDEEKGITNQGHYIEKITKNCP